MLLAAVLLGALPSLGNSFIAVSLGYLTKSTGDSLTYFYVLLCLDLAAAFANAVQNQLDAFFDIKFPARLVYLFRILVPTLIIAILLVYFGESLAVKSALRESFAQGAPAACLICVAIVGFCNGCLSNTGAIFVGEIEVRHLPFVWVGVSGASLLCVAVVWIVGFTPGASASCVRTLFYCAAGLTLALGSAYCALHVFTDTHLESAHYRVAGVSAEEALDVNQPPMEAYIPWSSRLQGCNAFMTVLCFPLLPLLHCPGLEQELVMWKFGMDFMGPLMFYFFLSRGECSLHTAIGVSGVRLGMLTATLYILLAPSSSLACAKSGDARRWLLALWDLLMLTGAMMNSVCDTSSFGSAPRVGHVHQRRLRCNRLSHNIGCVVGLLAAGAIFLLPRTSPSAAIAGSKNGAALAACPRCTAAEEEEEARAGSVPWPCGTAVGASSVGNESEGFVKLFHYGANMGCDKLSALGVQPQSATPVRAVGWCLRFSQGRGVNTNVDEPAFGTLERCSDGCVHGVLHVVHKSQLPRIDASERGYVLTALGNVSAYDGGAVQAVRAYVMQHPRAAAAAPSRRYAGLVYCQAAASLARAYSEQLACELGRLGLRGLDCKAEEFEPLAVAPAPKQMFLSSRAGHGLLHRD